MKLYWVSDFEVGNEWVDYVTFDDWWFQMHVVYYFAVTAYDSEGHESGYSNQVSTADFDTPDEFRSVGSGDSGADVTGCFIQSTK